MALPFDVTTQEYIEVIYTLERENRVARVTEIAERRGVTKSSVSLVMNQLQQKELIERKQYGHITLTPSGKRLGAKLIRRHEVIRMFLQAVGVSPAAADDDACKLEHIVSSQTWNAMRHFLDVLQNCPVDMRNIIQGKAPVTLEHFNRNETDDPR